MSAIAFTITFTFTFALVKEDKDKALLNDHDFAGGEDHAVPVTLMDRGWRKRLTKKSFMLWASPNPAWKRPSTPVLFMRVRVRPLM